MKPKTDADYIALDDAIGVLMKWQEELLDALAKLGYSHRTLAAVMQAMANVHSPQEESDA